MKKINYYAIGTNILEQIPSINKKPSLLLHVCCAPCSTYPLELLRQYFDITIYYSNSNIYPETEYIRRLEELKNYLTMTSPDVHLVIPEYDNPTFTQKLAIRKDDKEGYARCRLCFYLRLDEAYAYASKHGFDYFTTALTISRQKNEQAINRIGLLLQKRYPNTIYIPHDFKKRKGIDRAVELTNQYQLYKQDYCGCLYSFQSKRSK